MNKAIFFDRDGTINEDFGYVFQKEKLKFKYRVVDALLLAKDKGYLIIVITNQSAVGRKMCKMSDVNSFNNFMVAEFKKYGVAIDAIYVCPHIDSDDCSCRKPKVGLFIKAAKDFEIDLQKSYCVGDNDRDVEEMIKLGVIGALVYKKSNKIPCFDNLFDFVDNLVK